MFKLGFGVIQSHHMRHHQIGRPQKPDLEANITSIGKTKLRPFLYIQDGRQPYGHLGFYRTANSAIRFADPKTLA